MTLRQRRVLAGFVLAALALFGAWWSLRLDYARKISIDVLDLVPAAERDPRLAIVRELAGKAEARTMLFVLTDRNGGPAPLAAAQRFAAELRRAAVFAEVVALGDPAWQEELARELFASRFTLLFPNWLRANDATAPEQIAAGLKAFLERPEAMAYQDLVTADPLRLVPQAVERLQRLASAGGAAHARAAVWARLAVSPLREEGQEPAFAAIDAALAATRAEFPDVSLRYTGVNRFAAASRARIQAELAALNTASLLAVVAITLAFIRRIHRGLHLVPPLLVSILAGWLAVTMAFDRVHIIVFVLGSMLAGVAIDYGAYLFMERAARPGETYGEKVRRVLKPLLASCLTTVTGFSLLLFSELPLIRQLGVFMVAGLLAALGAALAYFSLLKDPYLELRAVVVARAARPPRRRGARAAVLALAVVIGGLGLMRVTWRDDIRDLEVPFEELKREDAAIRAMLEQPGGRQLLLTHAPTRDAAREALRALEERLEPRTFVNLGAFVPTAGDFLRAREFVRERPGFASALRAALERHGFDADAFAPFFSALAGFAADAQPPDLDAAVARLQAKLRGPTALLLHTGGELNWFLTLAEKPPRPLPPEAGTIAVDQLRSLNEIFARYRESALRLSVAGLVLVGLGVLGTYGVRDGLRIFAIPLGACAAVFGLFGWLGHPLNMFHLLGAFLGVCLTHDYAIFSAHAAYRRESPPASVRISALNTAASFAVLAFSGIPVVRALGVTVTVMVVFALLAIELEHLRPLASKR